MRPMLAVSAGISLLLLAAGPGWAGGRSRTKGTESAADTTKDKETPASFNKTFQWEDKVVGPKDKAVDRDKIAAMQEQGRREDAAKRRDEGNGRTPRRPARAEGISAPATARRLPTMDIEEAGGGAGYVRKAAYTQPTQHDALDNLLAENGVGGGDEPSGREGLGKVLGTSPEPPETQARAPPSPLSRRPRRRRRAARRQPRIQIAMFR